MYQRQNRQLTGLCSFSQAIKDDTEAPLAVFDKRAATYIKLGKLDLAVSDAGSIIRREATNAIVRHPRILKSLDD